MKFIKNLNYLDRQEWLCRVLSEIPSGNRILDAGAGELQNKKYCENLEYVSQDFCQYKGKEASIEVGGILESNWDTSKIDLVCDITDIPEESASFDAILCSEVLEHIPEPSHALDEFERLLKPGGVLILTAPFSSNVHQAPYHFCTGFSKYWYEHHLSIRSFKIKSLLPNGDWFQLLKQEILRLGSLERQRGNLTWPLAYCLTTISLIYFYIRKKIKADDLACFGFHCIAVKKR